MTRFSLLSVALFLSLLLSSCADSTKYYRVKNAGPRISTLGFYVSPPPGKLWYEKYENDSLHYFKRLHPGNYALTTKATELYFDDGLDLNTDFLEYVRRQKEHIGNSDRYRNYHIDLSLEKVLSSNCVRYEYRYDDHGAKDKGHHSYVNVFTKGLVCIHPNTPRIGIDVSYMERTFPQTDIPSFRSEGEQFLSSLTFYTP